MNSIEEFIFNCSLLVFFQLCLLSVRSFLVYRNAVDFYVFIFHSITLMNLLVLGAFGRFLRMFSADNHVSANRNIF